MGLELRATGRVKKSESTELQTRTLLILVFSWDLMVF